MKKFTCVALAASLMAASAFPCNYKVTLTNPSDSEMKVHVVYAGSGLGLCNPQDWVVPANTTITKDVGACCTKNVTFEADSGSLAGYQSVYAPKSTGFGIRCASWSARVIPTADGSFLVDKQ